MMDDKGRQGKGGCPRERTKTIGRLDAVETNDKKEDGIEEKGYNGKRRRDEHVLEKKKE